ncbi:MAG: hypothetical protein INQ03_03870 [Candidatus Heimdallarchaeota archaeon]|nr:hypothetical protein [Candidatus Heimdallarchaeota archaeon]
MSSLYRFLKLVLVIGFLLSTIPSTMSNQDMTEVNHEIFDIPTNNKNQDKYPVFDQTSVEPISPDDSEIIFSNEDHSILNDIITPDKEQTRHISITDVNQDNFNDIIAVSYYRIVAYDGLNRSNIFYNVSNPGTYDTFLSYDYSNDDVEDLISINFNTQEINIINGINGSIAMNLSISTSSGLASLQLARLDNDSIMDLVVISNDPQVILLNGTDFSEIARSVLLTDSYKVYPFDQNKDGLDEIFSYNQYSGHAYLINGTDASIIAESTQIPQIETITHTDILQDGYNDLIFGNWNYEVAVSSGKDLSPYIGVYLGADDARVSHLTLVNYSKTAVLDIVVGTEGGDIYILGGSDLIAIFERLNFAGGRVTGLQTDYINDDEYEDIIISSQHSEIRVMNGKDFTELNSFSTPQNSVAHLSYGDLNGDNSSDIIAAGSKFGRVYIFLSDNEAPILKSVSLPPVRTSDEPLTFELIYSEPNIDEISFHYKTERLPETITIEDPEGTAVFTIASFQLPELQFWFTAIDSYGNSVEQGNETDPFMMPITSRSLWRSDILGYSQIAQLEMADVSGDGTPDIIAASYDGSVFFADGKNGSLLYSNFELRNNVSEFSDIVIGDFTADSILDVAVLGGSAASYLHVINGSDGKTVYYKELIDAFPAAIEAEDLSGDGFDEIIIAGGFTPSIYALNVLEDSIFYPETTINIGDGVVDIVVADVDQQGNQDFVVLTTWGDVIFYSGDDFTEIYNPTSLLVSSNGWAGHRIKVNDFNADGKDDALIAVRNYGNGANFVIVDGSNGVATYHQLSKDMLRATLVDYDNDGQMEIGFIAMASSDTDENTLNVFDPRKDQIIISLGLADTGIDIEDEVGSIRMFDVTSDQVPDFLIQVREGIFLFNGETGALIEIISDDPQEVYFESDNMIIYDLNDNFVQDIIYHTSNQILVGQGIEQVKSIFPILSSPNVIEQSKGDSLVTVVLKDFYNKTITDASVSLIISKVGQTDTQTLSTIANVGSYSTTLKPEAYTLGTWQILTIVDHPIYNNIKFSDYLDHEGKIVSKVKFSIKGTLSPEFTLSADNATFNSPLKRINGVKEGKIVSLSIAVRDIFRHEITYRDANISVHFNGMNYSANYIDNDFTAVFNLITTGLEHGPHEIAITITGDGIDTFIENRYIVDIVPQEPIIDLSMQIISIIFAVSTIFFFYIIKETKDIYSSLGIDPAEMYQSIKHALIAMSILFTGIIILGIAVVFINPLLSFIILLSSLLVTLLIILLYHFRITVKQYYALEFHLKPMMQTMLISLIVGLILGIILLIGQQVEWIDYQMSKDSPVAIPLTNLKIPRIMFEIGVQSFFTGFIYILIQDLLDTRSDIKHLLEIEIKTLEGYFPKEPSKLFDSINDEAKSTFIGLAKGFILWYALIIYTTLNKLELIGIVSLPLLAFFGPVIIAFLIFFRRQVLQVAGLIPSDEDTVQDKIDKIIKEKAEKKKKFETDKDEREEIDSILDDISDLDLSDLSDPEPTRPVIEEPTSTSTIDTTEQELSVQEDPTVSMDTDPDDFQEDSPEGYTETVSSLPTDFDEDPNSTDYNELADDSISAEDEKVDISTENTELGDDTISIEHEKVDNSADEEPEEQNNEKTDEI